MIELDYRFKEMYLKYYGNISSLMVVSKIAEDSKTYSQDQIYNAMNISNACFTVGNEHFIDVYSRLYGLFMDEIDDDVIDKFIFDAIFMCIYNNAGPAELANFLDIRLTVRDIEMELALDLYGTAQDKELEKMRAIKTKHTYSIQTPNPVSRDRWFYDLALSVGSYAKCHSRKIGAVLVRDNAIISTGYNGPPRGIPDCDQRWFIDKRFKEKYSHHMIDTEHSDVEFKTTKGVCPRRVIGFPSGQGLEICPAGHAERNALVNAARLGVETKGTKLYMSCSIPCTPCMVEIINAGVEEIICSAFDIYDETALYLLENSKLKMRLYDFLA